MTELRLRVNGREEVLTVAPQVSPLDVLREYLGLTGWLPVCRRALSRPPQLARAAAAMLE
jgi:aerobic-type carbon monoxide dehydrogenase small subunit (CoxS/CutS family)